MCTVQTGRITEVGDGFTSGETVAGWDEWNAQETSGDSETTTWRVTLSFPSVSLSSCLFVRSHSQ